MAILASGKTDFKTKCIIGDKESHHIMIKGSINHMYVINNRARNNFTNINTLLSATDTISPNQQKHVRSEHQ